MKQGSKALKHIHGNMNIDKVDQTMDEIEEQVTLGQEISNAISRPLAGTAEFDDDELNDELKDLEQEVLEEKMVNVGPVPLSMPEAPSTKLKSAPSASKNTKQEEESDEEEELKRLQAEMAL